jgi:3',5'-cyclic AMP phosphodiesterase CpdA
MGVHESPSIRWLHVSDVHVRVPQGNAAMGDQRDVIDAALRFIAEKVPEDARPDYAFVTGDTAFSGTVADYTDGPGLTVRGFLDRLCEAARVDKTRLFVVSGNHDVNRDAILKACAKDDVALARKAADSIGRRRSATRS